MRIAVPIITVSVALIIIFVLVVAAKAMTKSAMHRSLRFVLLALGSLIGLGVTLIAIVAVTLSLGYWPFPWGPDGP